MNPKYKEPPDLQRALAFIDASISFLRDVDELRRMGADAAEHVRKNFSFDLQLSRTLDLYRSITTLD